MIAIARPAAADGELVEVSCELDVEVGGAIADVSMRERFALPADADAPRGARYLIELPRGAELIAASAQSDGAPVAAIAVPAVHGASEVEVGAADPLVVEAMSHDDDGARRYLVTVAPIAPGRDVMIGLRWIAIATVQAGALHVVVPAHGGAACRGSLHATPGPGATVRELRADGALTTGAFFAHVADVELDVALALPRGEPIAWSQTQALGGGLVARATTVIAPPGRPSARRAVIVIDGSRSMDLVGRDRVKAAARAAVVALPADAKVEAIVFDRAATTQLGGWRRADDPATARAIEQAIAEHAAANGSDLAAALAIARETLGGDGAIVAITDGALAGAGGTTLAAALRGAGDGVSVHAIVLDPPGTPAPDGDALRALVATFGGTYVELDTSAPIGAAASWLDRAWLDVAIDGAAIGQLRAGDGTTRVDVTRDARAATVTMRRDRRAVHVAAKAAASAPIAQLAKHAAVDDERSLVVVRDKRRRAAIASGAEFMLHVAASEDGGELLPPVPALPAPTVAASGGGGLDKEMLQRMFELQLVPHARACYERALPRKPTLEGKIVVEVDIGRGEIASAHVAPGLGDAALDACMVEAAYGMVPPLLGVGASDERVIARYPLELRVVKGEKPVVVAGDAESETPIDLRAVERGCKGDACFAKKQEKTEQEIEEKKEKPPQHIDAGDTRTPLGGMRTTTGQ